MTQLLQYFVWNWNKIITMFVTTHEKKRSKNGQMNHEYTNKYVWDINKMTNKVSNLNYEIFLVAKTPSQSQQWHLFNSS